MTERWPSAVRRLPFVHDVSLAVGASAAITLVGRFLGLLSQRIVLGELGASAALDGYFIALIVPALLVTPASTVLETTVAPAVTRLRDAAVGDERGLARRYLLGSLGVGSAVALGAYLLIEPLVNLSAPAASADQLRSAQVAAEWVYPAMCAQFFSSAARAVMYGRGRFQVPIAVGVVNPVAMIALLFLRGDFGIGAVAQASAAGFVAEAVVLLWLVRDCVPSRKPSESSERFSIGIVPVLLGQFVVRSVFYVNQVFVSSLEEGAVTQYAIALRLYDAVAAVFVMPNARMASVRIASVNLHELAGRSKVEFRRGVKVGLGAAVFLAVGSPAVIVLGLGNGEFTGSDVWSTTYVALAFAAVLPAASAAHIGSRALVAVGKSWAVPRLGVFEVVGNVVLNAMLAWVLGPAGIALSTGVVYIWLSLAQRRHLARALPLDVPDGRDCQ